MNRAAAAILAIGAGACVSNGSERPAGEIYEEAVQLSGYSFRCHATEAVRFDQRLGRLLPWLEMELGKDRVAEVRSGMEMTLADTDFLSCPTREERLRARLSVDRLLKQLEARSKR